MFPFLMQSPLMPSNSLLRLLNGFGPLSYRLSACLG
jgi:hypothetical protein